MNLITSEEQQILLALALSNNQPHIPSVIRGAKNIFKTKGIEVKSEATYRKFLKQHKEENETLWAMTRAKMELFKPELPFIEREFAMHVHRGQLHFYRERYYNEALLPLEGKVVRIKSTTNYKEGKPINSIMVFDKKGKLICEAQRAKPIHPSKKAMKISKAELKNILSK